MNAAGDWLTMWEALAFVRERLPSSTETADSLLEEALERGTVQSKDPVLPAPPAGTRFSNAAWAELRMVGGRSLRTWVANLAKGQLTSRDATPGPASNPAAKLTIQQAILGAARQLWPDGRPPPNKKDRNRLIQTEFRKRGETPPSDRTIRRAFATEN
jgi:hypothetical protein